MYLIFLTNPLNPIRRSRWFGGGGELEDLPDMVRAFMQRLRTIAKPGIASISTATLE
jgi:hypothetical protein